MKYYARILLLFVLSCARSATCIEPPLAIAAKGQDLIVLYSSKLEILSTETPKFEVKRSIPVAEFDGKSELDVFIFSPTGEYIVGLSIEKQRGVIFSVAEDNIHRIKSFDLREIENRELLAPPNDVRPLVS